MRKTDPTEKKLTRSQSFINLTDNIKEVTKLLQMHTHLSGPKPGRKFDVEVLNKSALILACASWESFNEDIIMEAAELISKDCTDPNKLPKLLRQQLAEYLKQDKNELAVWNLAKDGWREEIKKNANLKLKKTVSAFNTPKAANLKTLYRELLEFQTSRLLGNGQKTARPNASNALTALSHFEVKSFTV